MALGNTNRVTDMTKGNPIRLIAWFGLPIFLGNIFQQFYNIVDTMIAGRYLGKGALTALGATASIYSLIMCLVSGFTKGDSILVSRAFGEGDEEKVRDTVGLMIMLNIILMGLLTAISAIGIGPLLRVLGTPEDIFGQAFNYMFIVIVGIFITIMYNTEAGILSALGNSRTPLVFLIVSSIINIVMDLVLVASFHMGVEGLAFATVFAQLVSAIACFIHIIYHYPMLHLKKCNFRVRRSAVTEMFTTGLSMALMYSIFSVGTVIMQSGINKLGEDTITAHLAARKLLEVLQLPISTLTNANATFVSQNYGAKNMERVRIGVKKSCLLGMAWSVVATIIVVLFSDRFVRALTSTKEQIVVDLATKYLWINIPFLVVLTVLLVLRMSLQSIGSKIVPLISSGMELGIKVIVTYMVIPVLGYLGVCIVEPVIWVICMIWLIIAYVIRIRKY